MAEACQQKQYYDRKIGTVNLKPGDLVLVKADAFKGKRKIKDRWDEDTWEVVHQIATDIPSYKVTNQHGKSGILHQNQLLLIVSEVGVPLCIGGWINGKLRLLQWNPPECPQRWVKTLGNMMWLQTSKGTLTYGGGNDVNAHWHWWIVNPMMNVTTHQTESQLARPNKGGVKWVSTPCVRRNDNACLPPWCRILPPTRRGTEDDKKQRLAKKSESTARAWGCAHQRKKRGNS